MSTCSQNNNGTSTKRALANRANSRRSTGPQTPEGKAISSRNAVVTGLTGRTVLLDSDDIDEYALHLARHTAHYLPVTEGETELVQAIADCEWRLRRIPLLEAGIYALGERQFAESFSEESRDVRNALIQAQTHLTYHRQLSNLSIQESRLLRQKEKSIAAFEELKRNRPQEPAGLSAALPTQKAAAAAVGASFGFEFSDASFPSGRTTLLTGGIPFGSVPSAPSPVLPAAEPLYDGGASI